jgi:hypothetical protein
MLHSRYCIVLQQILLIKKINNLNNISCSINSNLTFFFRNHEELFMELFANANYKDDFPSGGYQLPEE